MELEESSHHHACKRSRVGNGGLGMKIGHMEHEDEEDGEGKNGGLGGRNILPWQQHPSSRIYRVSRASGGKDRHSKVYTARGIRDRRVRLSVSTAIQFYDLQDRLGYDQPSKAIEWLIKAAAAAINELPSLDGFPELTDPGEDDKTIEADPSYNQLQQQNFSTKSGCSSTSETSKGSVLSLSRPESRAVKVRERARASKEDGDDVVASHHKHLTPSLHSQTSFTELLTGGGGGGGSNGATTIAAVVTAAGDSSSSCIQKQISTVDHFSQTGFVPPSQKTTHQLPAGFSSQSLFGSNSALAVMPFNIAASTTTTTSTAEGDHSEMLQFSFLQDHLIPVPAVAPPPGDYNLNFTISSGLAGFSRGTLQSNSPYQLPHHRHHYNHSHYVEKLSSPVEGSNLPFFFGAAAASATASTTVENHFPAGFDGRLHLCYGDGFRHSDLKGKGKG